MKKQKIVIALLAFVIIAFVGFGSAYASNSKSYPMSDKVAQKFGLNSEEVAEFFSKSREERREIRRVQKEEGLSKAVTDGIISEEQKSALLERHSQMEKRRMQSRKDMLEWKEESGIDFEKLSDYGIGGKQGFGSGKGKNGNCLGQY